MNNKARRKIKRYAREMERDGGLFGLEFDDIIIGKKGITAEGEWDGFGEYYLVCEFSKKAKLKKLSLSLKYDSFDGRMLQVWEFGNYKKFEKAIDGPYEDFYDKAGDHLASGKDSRMNKGIDMIESIPGMNDLDVTLWNYETYENTSWG